jgi:hypothetical protein
MVSNFPIKAILIIWLKLKISMENNKKANYLMKEEE